MKISCLSAQVAVACALITSASAQTGQRYPIRLILLKELHSGGTPQGSVVPFMVDQNVTDENGNVLVKVGTPAYGRVVWSRREGALSAPILDRPARLAVKLEQTYDANNKPLAITFGTEDNQYQFTRENTSAADKDPQLEAAWKDPEKRAIIQKLVRNFSGEQPQTLTPSQQQLLLDQAKELSLTHTADLSRSGRLADLGSFVQKMRTAESLQSLYGSAGPAIDAEALVAAVHEMATLTRASRGYVGGRLVGRNILASAGTVLDAYVVR
jgi:hypothetical protein